MGEKSKNGNNNVLRINFIKISLCKKQIQELGKKHFPTIHLNVVL